MKSPIFIFSLPRAGSTLLQRILMSHSKIASLAEPWLLLPFSYSHGHHAMISEYAHQGAMKALNDFIGNLPNKEKDFNESLGAFVSDLYEKQCVNGEIYFLDKTPRYHLIIREISELFPDAKFIFLFRNPLHVISSIMETFCDGGFYGLFRYNIDITNGVTNLAKGYELLKEKSLALNYEDLVVDPQKIIKSVCDYLELDFEPGMLQNFSKQDTKGKMGDPTGAKLYKKIQTKSLEKWKNTFNTRYRKTIIKRYIKNIDKNDLSAIGFDKGKLLSELDMVKTTKQSLLKDFLHITVGKYILKYNLNILGGSKTSKLARGKYMS